MEISLENLCLDIVAYRVKANSTHELTLWRSFLFFFLVKKTIPWQLLKWTKVIATAECVYTVCKFEIANLVTPPA